MEGRGIWEDRETLEVERKTKEDVENKSQNSLSGMEH